jgi:hypothetical protein
MGDLCTCLVRGVDSGVCDAFGDEGIKVKKQDKPNIILTDDIIGNG